MVKVNKPNNFKNIIEAIKEVCGIELCQDGECVKQICLDNNCNGGWVVDWDCVKAKMGL